MDPVTGGLFMSLIRMAFIKEKENPIIFSQADRSLKRYRL